MFLFFAKGSNIRAKSETCVGKKAGMRFAFAPLTASLDPADTHTTGGHHPVVERVKPFYRTFNRQRR